MPNTIQIINPTLEENIHIVCALMHSIYGANPGYLHAYVPYSLTNSEQEEKKYVLTHALLQFVADPSTIALHTPHLRIDVVELTSEANGEFGCIFPVIKSIIFNNEHPAFDTIGNYIIKRVFTDLPEIKPIKPNKPSYFARAALREQYFASQMQKLGAVYQLIQDPDSAYLHMNRAPGLTLEHYIDKLDGEQFLKLACTLLEEVPQQLETIISTGKHAGKTIVHCDLKLSNIMAAYQDGNWIVTVIDMGLAKAMQEGQYTTKIPRGNILAFDWNMLFAKSQNHPIIYSAKTDLYALYTLLVILAGAKNRHKINREFLLNQEIYNPDLRGLFNNMDIPCDTKNDLHKLLIRMLAVDPEKRPLHSEILSAFRIALAQYKPKSLAQSSASQTVAAASMTAEDLKKCAEIDLDRKQNQYRYQGKEPEIILVNWLRKYRNLCEQTPEAEKVRFKTMLATPGTVEIKSRLIYEIIRLKLVEEYDNNACVRLITIHMKHTKPIAKALLKHSDRLPEQWFSLLHRVISQQQLQLTEAQQEYCSDLGTFIPNIVTLHAWQKSKNPPPIIEQTKEYLDSILLIDFEKFLHTLPELCYQFNALIYCIEQIKKTIYRYEKVCTRNFAFDEKLNQWAQYVPEQLLKGKNSPDELEPYFSLRNILADQIKKFYDNITLRDALYTLYPSLNQSLEYKESTVFKEINAISLLDTPAVLKLSKKIDTLLMLMTLHTLLTNKEQPLKKYPSLMELFDYQLEQLTSNGIKNPSILIEATSVFNHIVAAEHIEHFITRMNTYSNFPFIRRSFLQLMAENTYSTALAELLNKARHGLCMSKLDTGLENHLSLSLSEEQNQRLFNEIKFYCDSPGTYMPFIAPTAASSTPFGLFPVSSPIPILQRIKKNQASSLTDSNEFRY